MAKETSTSELDSTLEKKELSKEDIIFLLSLNKKDNLKKLFRKADGIRKEYIGDYVFIRGILEFSNHCKNDCLYCGIRRSNQKLERYRISPKEIIRIADNAVNKLGLKTILLQSGEDDFYNAEIIEDLIRGILKACDCRVALSIGEKSIDEYKRFYEAGARRCLVRFETSSKEIFTALHPSSSITKNSLEKRISLIKELKKTGYQVGTGPIIGLPHQKIEDLADDILLYNRLNINMAGMGPFIPHPETPLKQSPKGTFDMSLKMIAVTRIACKDIFISATTALQTINRTDGKEQALNAGANLLMPNITPKRYRELYQLYPGKACIHESPYDCVSYVKKVVSSVGRKTGEGYGDTIRK
ncbi:[FeFe] hydrogenase H-cluster radical SAM maturase HydE [Candidatus Woesearchaeota archaeon]|nr:[FeFe] hydrogenase H-cluster radical SAM maturase HydE [Candidatus Woesearchaeota archaeon]